MKKMLFFISIIVIVIYAIIITNNEPKILDKIRYATVPVTVDSLFHVAYSEGFFEEQGLDIDFLVNPDGKTSLDQLFNDKADIIAVTATPVVYSSFQRDDFYILADIKHTDIHKVIVRKSSKIEAAKDLKGKKLATMKGTSGEFFMDTYLTFNNVNLKDNSIIKSLNAPQMLDAFLNNEIDGFFCWEPFVTEAKTILRDEALILPNEDVFVGSWLIVTKKEFLKNNPLKVKNFLKALHKAEDIIQNNREAAIEMHSEITGVDNELARKLFSSEGYTMKLDESLLNLLEDQAQWLIDYKYVHAQQVPNYLKRVHTKSLETVKPDAVTIIGYQ